MIAYFIWYSLHARVEADWFAPVYPPFPVAAAFAAQLVHGGPQSERSNFCLRWAAPTGIAMFALLIVQANTGVLRAIAATPPCAASASAGAKSAGEIEAARMRAGATCCSRRITAPPAGSPSICRRAPASRSKTSASAGSTCPNPMRRSLAASCSTFARLPRRSPLKDNSPASSRVGEVTRKRGPLVDRDLCARCTGGAEGRGARPLAAAGTGVGRRLSSSGAPAKIIMASCRIGRPPIVL